MHDTTTTTPKDFLISYNLADQAWAEWIAWQLEAVAPPSTSMCGMCDLA